MNDPDRQFISVILGVGLMLVAVGICACVAFFTRSRRSLGGLALITISLSVALAFSAPHAARLSNMLGVFASVAGLQAMGLAVAFFRVHAAPRTGTEPADYKAACKSIVIRRGS